MTTLEREAPAAADPVANLVGALSRIQTVATDIIAAVGRNEPVPTRAQLLLAGALDDALAAVEPYQATAGTRPPVDMLAPARSYWPERMGYLSEVRHGDRVLFAGGWREVATFGQDPDGMVRVTFTDPDMDELVDEGTHAIRIQRLADEQELDALHRRDTGGL